VSRRAHPEIRTDKAVRIAGGLAEDVHFVHSEEYANATAAMRKYTIYSGKGVIEALA
jgi:hypothetical protein